MTTMKAMIMIWIKGISNSDFWIVTGFLSLVEWLVNLIRKMRRLVNLIGKTDKNIEEAEVKIGETRSFYGGAITIYLVHVNFFDLPVLSTVTAIIWGLNNNEIAIEAKTVGSVVKYVCEADYDIRIKSVNRGSVTFQISKSKAK